MKKLEIALSDEDIDSLVAEISVSGSGRITKDDFKQMVKKYEHELGSQH